MKKILGLFFLAGMTRVADAHTVAADDGLIGSLLHQILGLHHLPLTLLLIAGGILLFRHWRALRKL